MEQTAQLIAYMRLELWHVTYFKVEYFLLVKMFLICPSNTSLGQYLQVLGLLQGIGGLCWLLP